MNSKLLPLLRDQAIRFHQSGNLTQAERLYFQILAAEPADFKARHLLGVLRFQQGKNAEALELIAAALASHPDDAEALTNCGLVLQALGRTAEALASNDKALAHEPGYALAWNNRGNCLWELKQLAEALTSFDRALAIKPDYAEAWNNRGVVLRDLTRPQEALESYDRALALNPHYAEAWYNRGNALRDRPGDALTSYNRALAIRPHHAGALYNRANILRGLGRFAEARTSYEKNLALAPDDPQAWNNLGITLREMNLPEEAIRSHDRALAIAPDDAVTWYNRGRVLQLLLRFPEALADYDRALALDPGFAAAWNNRGNSLRKLGRFGEALLCYDKVLALEPGSAQALNNRANTLQDLGRFGEALAGFDHLLAIHPDNAEALYNRGTTLLHLHRFAESLESQRQALAADPGHRDALGGAANAAMHLCDWAQTGQIAPALTAAVGAGKSLIPPFVLLGYSGDAALQRECAQKYLADRIPVRPPRLWRGVAYRHRRIRLAYISSDFRRHPVAYQIAGLIERHDRSRFEVLGLSLGADDGSDIRARLARSFDGFHDVRGKSDEDAARLLRDLEVDIAIDLNGHTQDARPGILAHRPAPVQVNYLGYPGTMGADFIDYVIGDGIVLPVDSQAFFAEKIVQLPHCYLANESHQPARPAPSRRQAGLPAEGFVFCCFNSNWKITPPLFDISMRLLRQTEGSLLWLKSDNEEVKNNLRREAAARGVGPERLVFAATVALDDHHARYQLADLFLDTLPYNAHATACDALLAGVPLVTCAGDSFSGRVAASLLTALGLPELVTQSPGRGV